VLQHMAYGGAAIYLAPFWQWNNLMKQIVQNLKTGKTYLEDLPVPSLGPGQMLIKTGCSLVSLGTERMLVEFGKANLLQKARQQPDKVKQVLDKIKSDGLMPTIGRSGMGN